MKSVSLDRDSFWQWRLVVVDSGNVVQDRILRGPEWWVTRKADAEAKKLKLTGGDASPENKQRR